MKKSLKRSLFPGRQVCFVHKTVLGFLFLFSCSKLTGQIANYVNNGGFETTVTTTQGTYPKFWGATDTTKNFGLLITGNPSAFGFGYQLPRNGDRQLISTIYCSTCTFNQRAYPRNRLKRTLTAGNKYCTIMYVNLSNQSTHGIAQLGFYFADSSIDTITKCTSPITYLIPQIENPTNNIITDTANWVEVKGQFVANGTEKYLLIGNFYSDTDTDTLLVNPTNLPMNGSDYLFDDISLIEVNLPAYAGPDTVITPGDSAFIGREPDFAIDPGCRWYRLPGVIPMDTISGMWVKPTTTTTYVVRQELECSAEKWDTVVVHVNLTRLDELKMLEAQLRVFPVPVADHLEVTIRNDLLKDGEAIKELRIVNNLGQLTREKEVLFTNKGTNVNTSDFPEGVYTLELKTSKGMVRKRFVVAR